jgi:hypothetical protein
LSDKEVADFVDRFMPAYKLYISTLYSSGPQKFLSKEKFVVPPSHSSKKPSQLRLADDVPVLKITVDINRLPISMESMSFK